MNKAEKAVEMIKKTVLNVSKDPNDLPDAESREGCFLAEVYELLELYKYI